MTLELGFQELRSRVFRSLESGDWHESLRLALLAEVRYPGKGEVPFWLACLHGRRGEGKSALAALRAGLGRGLWWPEEWLLEDDDLAVLHGSSGLAAVAEESSRRRAGARPAPKPAVLPAAELESEVRAVVLALHGWGQEAGEFAAELNEAIGHGVALIVPESAEELTPGFFVWDDRDAARRAVVAQYESSIATLVTVDAPLVIAGFSQGGGLAVDLALDGLPAPAAGVLAFSAGVEDLEAAPDPARLRRAAGRGLRARLVAGAEDEALEGAHALSAAAEAAGLDWPLTVLDGAGHEMPAPGSGLLTSELAALTA